MNINQTQFIGKRFEVLRSFSSSRVLAVMVYDLETNVYMKGFNKTKIDKLVHCVSECLQDWDIHVQALT